MVRKEHIPSTDVSSVEFSSVQEGIYALGKANNYALHLISQKFPQRCLCNGSTVRLIDDGPFLSFEGRSSRASSFHASLLKAIDSVLSLALSPQVVSQASQHFRSSEKQATDVESEKKGDGAHVLGRFSGMGFSLVHNYSINLALFADRVHRTVERVQCS